MTSTLMHSDSTEDSSISDMLENNEISTTSLNILNLWSESIKVYGKAMYYYVQLPYRKVSVQQQANNDANAMDVIGVIKKIN